MGYVKTQQYAYADAVKQALKEGRGGGWMILRWSRTYPPNAK